MKVKIVAVGKIKEKFWIDALNEFSKRLSRFCDLKMIEVADYSINNESQSEKNIAIQKESEKIISHLTGYKIALCIEGETCSSDMLAKKIDEIKQISNEITFIIGGSYGLSDEVKNMADFKLSFSRFTFPHNMMRVILLEQVYRSFMINSNSCYHK